MQKSQVTNNEKQMKKIGQNMT